MLLKNDIITQKILIDNFIYAVTYQDGNFILHHDQLLSPASVDIVSIYEVLALSCSLRISVQIEKPFEKRISPLSKGSLTFT